MAEYFDNDSFNQPRLPRLPKLPSGKPIKKAIKKLKQNKKTKQAKKAAKKSILTVLKAIPPQAWLVIILVSLMLLTLMVVNNKNAAATRNHKTAELDEEFGNESLVTDNYKNDTLEKYVYSSDGSRESIEVEYDGDSEYGKAVFTYKTFFNNAFEKTFNEVCKKEVESIIKERGYNKKATMNTYSQCESPFMDINYAELISIVGQSPKFSYYNGSLEEMMEFLDDEFNLEYLFFMTVNEKLGYKTLYKKSKTSSVDCGADDSCRSSGELLEEKTYFVKKTADNDYDSMTVNDMDEFKAFAKDNLSEDEKDSDFKILNGVITNGRTIIYPYDGDTRPVVCLRTVLDDEYVEAYEDTEVEIQYIQTPGSSKKKAVKVEKKVTKHRKVTKYTESIDISYIYGECELFKYCLKDLYEMLELEPTEKNIDFDTGTNLEVLDIQEEALRELYAKDIELDLGTNVRTEMFSPFYAIVEAGTGEDFQNHLIIYNGDLSGLQKDIERVASTLVGTPYSLNTNYGKTKKTRMGGAGYGFDCISFAYYVYQKCGINLCNQNGLFYSDSKSIGNVRAVKACTSTYAWYRSNAPQCIVAYTTQRYGSRNIYDTTDLEPGDLIFIQTKDTDFNCNSALSHGAAYTSDHVYIYAGNGYMYEAAGGRINKVVYRPVQNSYKDNTLAIIRPYLINEDDDE